MLPAWAADSDRTQASAHADHPAGRPIPCDDFRPMSVPPSPFRCRPGPGRREPPDSQIALNNLRARNRSRHSALPGTRSLRSDAAGVPFVPTTIPQATVWRKYHARRCPGVLSSRISVFRVNENRGTDILSVRTGETPVSPALSHGLAQIGEAPAGCRRRRASHKTGVTRFPKSTVAARSRTRWRGWNAPARGETRRRRWARVRPLRRSRNDLPGRARSAR